VHQNWFENKNILVQSFNHSCSNVFQENLRFSQDNHNS
jgi:hypothetical protein